MFARRTNWNLATNRFTAALERHRAAGRELLDLTVSNPTACGLTYNSEALLAALANPAALSYCPDPRGIASARQAVRNYYYALGAEITPDDLVLTTSTSEAYSFAFRLLCDPGDEVLIPVPSYPLFDFLGDIQDVTLRRYELVYDHGWQIDFHSLRQAISPRARALLVVNPNNPTGSYVKPHELAELNALCREHGLALIADEVFYDYPLGPPPPSLAGNRDALTFTLSGISKISGLPQMKLAWMALSGPEELKADAVARLEVIADTYLSVNAPVQHALPVFLEERGAIQRQLNGRVRANLAELDHQLAAAPGIARLEIEGGWYACLRVPVTASDEELSIALLEQRDVLVHPGHFFDLHGEGFLIVSLITPPEVFREGVRRILT